MTKYNSSYNIKPTDVTIPQGTLCRYELSYSSKFNDTFTLTVDINVEVILKKTTDGQTSVITPNTVRNLEENPRNLVTTTRTFSVSDADSISIYYMSQTNISSPAFDLASANNYYVAPVIPDSSIDPDDEYDSPISGTNSKNTGSVIGLVVAACVIVGVMIIIGVIACIWQKFGKGSHERIRNGRNHDGHVVYQGEQISVSTKRNSFFLTIV